MKSFFLTMGLFASMAAFCQEKKIEGALFAGASNYSGDLAEDNIIFKETKGSFGVIGRYHFSPKFDLRGHFIYGIISGDDANSPDLSYRQHRFRSTVYEFALLGEWKILGKPKFNTIGEFYPNFTPYLFGGVAYVGIKPFTECYSEDCINGRNPFPEAGYKPIRFVAPVGGGLRYDFSEYLGIGGEFGFRLASNDYMDGTSPIEFSRGNDWYFFAGVIGSYFFGKRGFNFDRPLDKKHYQKYDGNKKKNNGS
jgi:hypothetical protein